MTAAVDDKGTQDRVAGYNGEGTTVASDAVESRVAMMAATVEDGGGRQRRRRRTTTVADDDGSRDWAADYDGEGRERAARDGGDRGVVMMAAAKMAVADDSGGGRQRRRRRTTAADHDGAQDWAAAYDGEGRERAANNNGIRHRTETKMLFLAGVGGGNDQDDSRRRYRSGGNLSRGKHSRSCAYMFRKSNEYRRIIHMVDVDANLSQVKARGQMNITNHRAVL